MAGTIYLVTNNLNGKQYVGQTIVAGNKVGHGTLMTRAYRKHGKENFTYEAICSNIDNKAFLNFAERFWIKVFSSRVPNGYNIDHGGSSKDKVSDETRKKLSIANTGKKHTAESKAKMAEAQLKRPKEIYAVVAEKLKGRKRPAHIGEAVKLAHTGKVVSEETKAKLSAFNKGKIVSEQTRLKLSLAAKKQWAKIKGEA